MNAKGKNKFGLKIPGKVAAYWNEHQPPVRSFLPNTFPLSIDWSSQDSQAKNQATCGACWAFAAVALVENLSGQQDLAEQEIVSCAAGDCNGGWYGDALKYVHDKGLSPENCYPYQATNGDCENVCENPEYLVQVENYDYYGHWGVPTSSTVNDLKSLLQTGAVCVSMLVPADGSFDGYSGGIYDYEGGTISSDRGHAVLVVGYDDNDACFKAKNSWGDSWGENGYFRIAYDDVTDDVQFGGYACTASGAYVSDPTAVELATFDFHTNKNEVELFWSTVSETENYGFDIQRSNGGAFETIGFVKGFGTTSEPQFYYFSDENLTVGDYQYRLRQIDFDGTAHFSPVVKVSISAPGDFRLSQNYPNPFNQETVFYFEVPHSAEATLSVYNMIGQKVKTLFQGQISPGYFSAQWNGADDFSRLLPSGVYYYQLQSADFKATRRMIIVR